MNNNFIDIETASSDWDGWLQSQEPDRRQAVQDAFTYSTPETIEADRKRFLSVTRIAQETGIDPFDVSTNFESHYQPQFAAALGKPELGNDTNALFGELVNRDRTAREKMERKKFAVLSAAQSALYSDNWIGELARFAEAKPDMDEQERLAWTESFTKFDDVLRDHRDLLGKSGKALESMSRRTSTDEDKKVIENLLDVVAGKEGQDREILMQAILLGAEEVGQRAKENKGKMGEVVPEANGIPSHLKDAGGARGAASTFGGAAVDLFDEMYGNQTKAFKQSRLNKLNLTELPQETPVIDSPEAAKAAVDSLTAERVVIDDGRDVIRPSELNKPETKRFASEEETALLQAEVNRQNSRIKVMREFKTMARKADPFDTSILGTMASGTASTLTLALPLALGPVGVVIAGVGYANMETESLLTEFPDMDPDEAVKIGIFSGSLQAALDKATLFGLDKFAPNIRQILIGNGTRDLIKKSIGKGVALGFFENAVEAAQDATTPVVQQIVADLSKSVPGVDWNKEWKEFAGSRADVFIGMLPLMLLGMGVNTALDRNSQRVLLSDDAEMRRMGFVQEDRVAVAEALANDDVEGAQAILNEAMDRRDPALAAEAGNEHADKQIAAYQFQKRQIEEAERRGLIPEIRPRPDGTFSVTDKESGETVVVSRAEAMNMAYSSLTEQERKSSEAVAQLAEELSTDGDQLIITGPRQNSKTVGDEGLMKPDEVAAGVEAAAAMSGMDPAKSKDTTMAVLGFNRFEQIENARVAVSRIFGGGNVATVIEEVVHGRWKRGLENNVFTREQGLAWVRNAERTINSPFLPEGMKDEDVTPRLLAEAVAAVTVADLIGNRKTGNKISAGLISSGLAAWVRSEKSLGVGTTAAERKNARATSGDAQAASVFSVWMGAWKGFFGNVLAAAKRMRVAKEKGMLGEDHDAFLDQMWGLDGDALEQQREADALRDLNDEVETLASMVPRLDSRLMNGMVRSDESAQANKTLTSAISSLHRLGGGDVGAAGTADVVKALTEAGVKRVSGIEEVDPGAVEGKSGTEHATWASPSGRIIKALLTPGVATEGVLAGSKFGMNLRLDDYLTRFAMGNVLFGDDARLEGIDDQGRIYVSQPFYGGRGSEGKDTYKAMTEMGWLSNRNSSFSYISPNRMLFIEDLHAKNASISDDGHFMPFDILFFTSEQMSFWTDPDEFMEAYEREPQSLTEFWNGINKIEDLGFKPDPIDTTEMSMVPSITAAMDAEYLSAAERGDMETAQRMVDEAAKKAGFQSAEVIHSTNAEFRTFGRVRAISTARGRVEIVTPIKSTGMGLIYATQNSSYSALFGDKQLRLYHSISNPADLRSLGSGNVSDSAFDELLTSLGIAHRPSAAGMAPVFDRLNKGQHKQAMIQAGFDGFALREKSGNLEADAIAGFDSSQFKSADPVTYDEQGNPVPLSQRFNTESNDINFSMVPQVTLEQIEASVAPVVTVNEALWTGVDQSAAFPNRQRASNDVPIKTPVGDEPSKMSSPRVNIYNPVAKTSNSDKDSKPYMLPIGLSGIKDRKTLIEKLNEQMGLMHAWATESPESASAALSFYSGMGDAGYELADGDIDAADLYLRWFAFLSPRASVISNAAKAIGGGTSAFVSEFTPGFKAGTVNQVLGMSTIADEWQKGEAFAMHLKGVDNKVRNFYLNGASELLHRAIRENKGEEAILKLAKKLATSLSVSIKTAGGVEVKVETLEDIPKLQTELDRLVTSDMWDQAALGNVRAGFVIGQPSEFRGDQITNKFSNYIWTDPRPEAGSVISIDSDKAQYVLAWHKKFGERKKEGIESWADLTTQELETLDFDPVARTIRVYSKSDDGAALLAAGGEGPTYDISQALSGMMADIINASGGMAGKQVWTAYNVQEFRWGMEKVKNPRKSMRDFSSYDEVVDLLREFSVAFESGEVANAAGAKIKDSLKKLKKRLKTLQDEKLEAEKKGRSAETKKAQEREIKIERLTAEIKSTQIVLNQTLSSKDDASRGKKKIESMLEEYNEKDLSRAVGSVTAAELAYSTQARQLMPFELQSEKGGDLYKTVFNQAKRLLARRGESNPTRALVERIVGPGFLEGMQKTLYESGIPVTLRRAWVGTGSYEGTMSPNVVFEMSGPRWATSLFNVTLAKALEQTGGNVFRNPTLVEKLGGRKLTTVLQISLPQGFTEDQIRDVMVELGKLEDSKGQTGGKFIGGHTVLENQKGDPVIAIHGGFYGDGFDVELEAVWDKIIKAAEKILGPSQFKLTKQVVEKYENNPKLEYKSKRGKPAGEPTASRGDSSAQQEGGGEVGTSTSEDSVGRNPVERIRSYFLARIASSVERGSKPGSGLESVDPMLRMVDLIGRSWEAVNAKRRGEPFEVPEDIRMLTDKSNIESEILQSLSASVVAEGLDNPDLRGVGILLWDIAQRVARKKVVSRVDVLSEIDQADLDKLNQSIVDDQAVFIETMGRLGFKVFGDGRFKAPEGFGLLEHEGERILVNLSKAKETWKTGAWDEKVIQNLKTQNPKIKTGVEIAGIAKDAYGYAVTYDVDGKLMSTEAINNETGRRMLGAELTEEEVDDEALASMARQPLAAVAQSLLDDKYRAPTYRKVLFDVAKARLGDLRRDGEWRVDKWGKASKKEGMDSKTEKWVERKKSELDREQQFREGMEYDRLLRENFNADTPAKQEALPTVDRQAARSEAKTAAMQWRKAEEAKVPSAKDKQMAALRTLGALLSAFPPKIKGQVMGFEKLASLSTDKAREAEIARRIDILDDVVEKEARKEYAKEMEKLLERTRPKRESGQKPKGRFGSKGSDIHSLFDTIEQAMRWTSDKANGYADGLDKSVASGDLNAEEEEHARIEAEMVRMVADWYPRSAPTERKDKAGRTIFERVHEGADSARMQVAVEEMERLVKGAYERAKAEAIMRRERQKAKRLIMRAQAGSAGTPRQRDDEMIRRNRLGEWFRSVSVGMLSFEGALEWAFGPSAEVQEIADRERTASNQKEDEIQAKTEALSDLFTDLAGGSTLKGEKLRYDMGQKSVGVRDRKLSQLEMITASLMWSQHDGRRHMRGRLDEDGKPIGAWHYDQGFMDELESKLTPEAKAVRQFLVEQYGSEWADLNKVFRRLNGINLPSHENYAPVTVKPMQGEKGVMNDPTTGMSMGNSSTPGSLRSRSGHIAEPDFRDALQVFISHTKQMAHWKAYAELVNDIRPILLNREVTHSVTAATSEQTSKVLSNWLDFFERGGTRDAAAFLTLSESMGRATSRAATVALVGRIGTLLLQSTQLGAAVTQMPAKEYAKRLAMLFAGQLEFKEAINSDYIQRRIKQMPPVVQQALEGLAAAEPSRLKHEIRRVGQLLSSADGFFTAGTFAIIYDYHLAEAKKAGLDGTEAKARALKIAERLTDRAAQPTRAGARSLFENTATNPWLRLSWNFASEGRKNIGLMLSAGRQGMTSSRFAKAVLFTMVINSGFAWILRTAWKDLRDDDDDEIFDAEHWSLKRMALAMGTEWMSGVPAMGAMVQAAIYGVAGEWAPEGNLFSGAARAAKVASNDLPKLLAGDLTGKEMLRDAETILAGLAVVLPTSAGADSVAAAASLSHLIRDVVDIADNAGLLETD